MQSCLTLASKWWGGQNWFTCTRNNIGLGLYAVSPYAKPIALKNSVTGSSKLVGASTVTQSPCFICANPTTSTRPDNTATPRNHTKWEPTHRNPSTELERSHLVDVECVDLGWRHLHQPTQPPVSAN